MWDTQQFPNIKWLQISTRQKLTDLFLNDWYSSIQTSNKCLTYRMFKNSFNFEDYLIKLPSYCVNQLIKFRTRNHQMPVEKGDWTKTPFDQRICKLCSKEIGDEFHYLFVCRELNSDRKQFIKSVYLKRPSVYTLEKLINSTNKSELIRLCKYFKIMFQRLS